MTMTQIEIHELILDLCKEAGEDNGVHFRWVQPPDAPRLGGEWEVDCSATLTVTIRHWLGPELFKDATIPFPTDFPLTEEQKEVFIQEVVETLDTVAVR